MAPRGAGVPDQRCVVAGIAAAHYQHRQRSPVGRPVRPAATSDRPGARAAELRRLVAGVEYFENDPIKAALLISLPFMPFTADLGGWALIYLGVLSKYGVAMFEGGSGSFPAALIKCLQEHGGRGGEEITARRGMLTAFYRIDDEQRAVAIVDIVHRRDAYRTKV